MMPEMPFRPSLAALIATAVIGHAGVPSSAAMQQSERSWHEQLEPADRAALQRLLTNAPPPFADNLKWHNVDEGKSWQDMRDTVVVIQSWTSANEEARLALSKAAEVVSEFSDIDVQIIALHTPESADKAEEYLAEASLAMPVVVDPVGEFCDAMGVYRHPVNIVVDRNGAVRYAGLTPDGLKAAINRLINDLYDPAKCPDAYAADGGSKGPFPPIDGRIGNAKDIRGQEAPELRVEEWITPEPSLEGKVVVFAHWATWCGPCINTIPRMNQIAERFRDEIVVVGVSDEALDRLKTGMSRRNLTAESFQYSIGTDSRGTMKRAMAVRGIPHGMVISSDWVVRWQGHPGSLTDDLLQQIIEADRGTGAPPRRWVSR